MHHPAKLFAVFIAYCDGFSLPGTHRNQHHHAITTKPTSATKLRLIPHYRQILRANVKPLQSTVSEETGVSSALGENEGEGASDGRVDLSNRFIIQWRGEGTEGYSEALRQLEFTSAFRAEMADCLMINNDDDDDDANDNNNGSSVPSPELRSYLNDIQFRFQDALTYHGPIYEEMSAKEIEEFDGEPIPLAQVQTFESAMQYATITLPSLDQDDLMLTTTTFNTIVSTSTLGEAFQYTIERCSLIRNAFEIAAEGDGFEQLAEKALDNGSFDDKMEGGTNADATWSIRLRRYGPIEESPDNDGTAAEKSKKKSKQKHARYGKNVRSPLRDERKAIFSMVDLVERFEGKVDLANPECRIYLLEGLKRYREVSNHGSEAGIGDTNGDGDVNKSKLLLARVIAEGPKTSIYRPNTRICVTTTPLCPIASFTLCNIAQVQRHQNPAILDPFAGSCATLLAAAHITSLPSSSQLSKPQPNPGGCRSIAIEIAHDGYVNKDDIVEDFVTRSLTPPSKIIHGSCLSSEVRDQARLAIGKGAFDAIVTDPPYGIREAMSSEGDSENSEEDSISPLTKLFYAMGDDRSNDTPLLKSGGRLVAFVPVREGEILEDCLPDSNAREAAGLVMEGEGKEQVLSDILSRWLVSFICL